MYETLHHRFWSLLNAITDSKQDVRLVSLEANEARFIVNKKRLLVILLDERPQDHNALQNWAKVLLEEVGVREIDLVVLTPSDEVDRTLSETDFQVPWTRRLAIFTLNEEGVSHEISKGQGDAIVRGFIEASLSQTYARTPQEVLRGNLASFVDAEARKASELQQFQRSMQGYSSLATHVLLASIGVFYVIQLWLGAETYGPGLIRLGADSAILVQRGEYWRLVTSIFLHGGLLHVAANGYVLYALGTFFNKLIGNARFLTLFFVSGVAGSLASVFIGKSMLSVGASGALWGLFGLSAALIIKPTRFFPDEVRQSLRNITVINLVINLAFSFAVPMIDKWAHFGGGVAGFLIGLAFVVEPNYKAQKWVHRVLAGIVCSIAAFSVAVNLYVEKPWILAQPLELTKRSIFKNDAIVGIPSFLELQEEREDMALFGSMYLSPAGAVYFDPYTITVSREKLAVGATHEALRSELETLLGVKLKQKEINGIATFYSTFIGKENQAAAWSWFQLRDGFLYSVQIIGDPSAPATLTDNLERIMESLENTIQI